jgi:hypothetical protein
LTGAIVKQLLLLLRLPWKAHLLLSGLAGLRARNDAIRRDTLEKTAAGVWLREG